ncbi:HalOD1 output domain-containing protein [Natronomonas salsuginis]|uniref:Halobacterial output domain-containing protein n=1 Tax=Natronomonas salsuginis TaxID=2217661 RepID=A0A4U5JI08_9EURY|nr:HalOD1 output domain-containing protein [Natronomonas salsuginis]TKR27961.1 hypothetical protein DM868_02455 [Natronomonas salsuginis]
MASADDDTEAVVFESAFDPTDGPVSLRVVEAVATFYEVESTDIDPLYSVIDSDALDALFDPSRTGRRLKGVVTFQYENVAVSVNGDGTIRLSDPA